MSIHKKELHQKLVDRSAKVVVLGLGYVGLPLAAVLAEAGFKVIGVDPDHEKVSLLNQGISYIDDVDTEVVAALTALGYSIVEAQSAIQTIPKDAPNPEAALAFVDFILSKDKGMKVMEREGQP